MYLFLNLQTLFKLTSFPKTELSVLHFFLFFFSILFWYFLFYCWTNYHLVMHRGEAGAVLVQLFKGEEDTWIN